MSTEQKGAITTGVPTDKNISTSSRREELLKQRKTITKILIASGTAASIGFGGMGIVEHRKTGVEERLGQEMHRPPTTELNDAQQTYNQYKAQRSLFDQCGIVYSPDTPTCQALKVERTEKIDQAEQVISQEEVFKNEAKSRKDKLSSLESLFGGLGGVGFFTGFFAAGCRRINNREIRKEAKNTTAA